MGVVVVSRECATGFLAACAVLSGSATACEWHEMMAYGDGAPQRYSPFSRAEQHAAPPAPAAVASEETAEAQIGQAQDNDAAKAARDRSNASGPERAETVLVARQ